MDTDDGPRTEYLRIINRKDTEIQRLLMTVERNETEARKEQERLKAKISELRAEIDSLRRNTDLVNSTHHGEHSQMMKVTAERDALRRDIAVLKDALQKQEDHFQGVLRAAKKAEKAESRLRTEGDRVHYADLEERLAHAHGRIDSLVAQRHDDEKELFHLRREVEKWKQEAETLRSHAHAAEDSNRELRLRSKDFLSKAIVSTEINQLESRHSAIVTGLEREIGRLRDEARERALQIGRQDAMIADYRKKLESMEQEMTLVSRRSQDHMTESAMELLKRQHAHEETKLEYQRVRDSLNEQIQTLLTDRGQLEGDLLISQRRIQELEMITSQNDKRFAEDNQANQKEIFDLRQKLHGEAIEAADAKRKVEMLQAELNRSQARLESLRLSEEEVIARLRQELNASSDVINHQKERSDRAELAAEELRRHLSEKVSEQNRERADFVKQEQEYRQLVNDLRTTIRAKEDEYQQSLRKLDLANEEAKDNAKQELLKLQTESRSATTALTSKVKLLMADLESAAAAAKDHQAIIDRLQNAVDTKTEREKSLLTTIRELDTELRDVKYDAAEKEGAIATLKRSLETTGASLSATRSELETRSGQLDAERRRANRLEEQVQSLSEQVVYRDRDIHELTDAIIQHKKQIKDAETAATALKADLTSTQRTLANTETALSQLKQEQLKLIDSHHQEMTNLEQSHADDCGRIQREVLIPLQEKVEALVAMNSRLHDDIADRDSRLSEAAGVARRNDVLLQELREAQAAIATRERRIANLEEDLREEQQNQQVVSNLQRDRAADQDDIRRLKADNDSLVRKINSLESAVESATREAIALRSRDTDNQAQLQARRSEISALKEKVANAESFKVIAEKAQQQAVQREQELVERFEHLKAEHQTLQACFNKQQEQLENAEKMRQRDLRRDAERKARLDGSQ